MKRNAAASFKTRQWPHLNRSRALSCPHEVSHWPTLKVRMGVRNQDTVGGRAPSAVRSPRMSCVPHLRVTQLVYRFPSTRRPTPSAHPWPPPACRARAQRKEAPNRRNPASSPMRQRRPFGCFGVSCCSLPEGTCESRSRERATESDGSPHTTTLQMNIFSQESVPSDAPTTCRGTCSHLGSARRPNRTTDAKVITTSPA
jgi:hypothetical protein